MKKRNLNIFLALSTFLSWIFLIVYIRKDPKIFKNKIGVSETLKQSSFARGMFMDIGALSTIISAWMIWGTKSRFRFIFAILTLFVGSFAVLPFLTIYFISKSLNKN